MPCEEYREALSEAAAAGSGQIMPRDLRVHLDVCSGCNAEFRAEQELFAAINSGVQKIASAEVPPSLLPRVRERMEREGSSRRGFLPYLVFAAAAAFALVVVLGMREWRRNEVALQLTSVTDRPTASKAPWGAVAVSRPATNSEPVRKHTTRDSAATKDGKRAEFAVLVPAGQKEAVDKLLSALQSGAVKPGELVVEKAGVSSPNLEVSPLAIPPIEVKPLATIGDDSPAESEKSKS